MNFTLVRIDDRLIHGQVALGWTRAKGIDMILAVDNVVAKDAFQCSLLKMATPAGVISFIVDETKAIEILRTDKYKNRKVMLLVREPLTLLHLLDEGMELHEVNVGNMRSGDGKDKLLNFVYVTKEHIEHFHQLLARGIELHAQSVPDGQSYDLRTILKSAG